MRRAPASTNASLAMPKLSIPDGPQSLAAAPEFAPTEASATIDRPRSGRLQVPIRLRAVPIDLPRETAGVATFQTATGTEFVWLPLSQASLEADGSLMLTSTALTRGELTVALASHRSAARHGYLMRRQIELPALGTTVPEVELAVDASKVVFQLPKTAIAATTLRVQRATDPQWLPMQPGNGGLIVPVGGRLELLLGAGRYEAIDPLQPERRLQFEVPSPKPIDVSAVQPRQRAGRP
jgi:hypothetical protein